MSRCPCCGATSDARPGNAGTCGDFLCLYRQLCGGYPPDERAALRSIPWGNPESVSRIAVVRPGQLGDLLLAVPGLRALRGVFPRAETTLVAQPWALDLPRRFRWLDRVLAVDGFWSGWGEAAPLTGVDLFLREARGYGYDLVLQLQGDSAQAARFALAMGGRATAGFCRDGRVGREFHLLLPMLRDEPEILRVMRLVHALVQQSASVGAGGSAGPSSPHPDPLPRGEGDRGHHPHPLSGGAGDCDPHPDPLPGGAGDRADALSEPEGVQLEFPPLPDDARELEEICGLREALERRPVVALHVGARAPARRWPVAHWVGLAQGLRRQWEATLVLVGGADESPLAEEMIRESGSPALNLAGKLSLGGLAALLRRVDLFVGNDSGPAQLASAVAPRSLRIFGPANPRRWAPLDTARHRTVYRQAECSPCDHWECPIDHRCLRQVSVEQVMAEVEALLAPEFSRRLRPAPSAL